MGKGKLIKVLCVYLILLLIMPVHTQQLQAQKKPTAREVISDFEKIIDSPKTKGYLTKPARLTPQDGEAASDGLASHDSVRFINEMKAYQFNSYHTQRSFTWQFYSGIIIFMMVVFIVVMGLVLSFRQFKLTELQVKANITKTKEEATTILGNDATIEISQTGLKINTAVIGLAILFLSLAFFFLYLKYVYVIEVVDL